MHPPLHPCTSEDVFVTSGSGLDQTDARHVHTPHRNLGTSLSICKTPHAFVHAWLSIAGPAATDNVRVLGARGSGQSTQQFGTFNRPDNQRTLTTDKNT